MSVDSRNVGWLLVGVLAFVGSVVVSCASTPLGATDVNLAQARDKVSSGAGVFAAQCASCHGDRGEGRGRTPALMGTGALPEYPRDTASSPSSADPEELRIRALTRPQGAPSRDPFRTAQDLHAYVSKYMPAVKGRAGTLKPDEYRAVVNFILVAHGVPVPSGGVNAANADSVSLPH